MKTILRLLSLVFFVIMGVWNFLLLDRLDNLELNIAVALFVVATIWLFHDHTPSKEPEVEDSLEEEGAGGDLK